MKNPSSKIGPVVGYTNSWCFIASVHPLATVEVAVETAKDGPLKPEEPLSSGCLQS